MEELGTLGKWISEFGLTGGFLLAVLVILWRTAKNLGTWIQPRVEKAIDNHIQLMSTLESSSRTMETAIVNLTATSERNAVTSQKHTEVQARLLELMDELRVSMTVQQGQLLAILGEMKTVIHDHHAYAVDLAADIRKTIKPPA